MAMISADRTGDGTCADCGAPAPLLPPRVKVVKGGGAHWRYCVRCHLLHTGDSFDVPSTQAERDGMMRSADAPVVSPEDLEREFKRRLGDE